MPKKQKTPHSTQGKTEWYQLTAQETAAKLNVDPQKGLSAAEAEERLQKDGPNILSGKKKESGFHAFARQYRDFMQIILVFAGIISIIFTAKLGTGLLLFGLTIGNALMGLKQEAKAQASIESLKKMIKNVVKVRRDGQATEVDPEKLVPGDIVLMEAGDRVPADGRLFVSASLEIEEAALTGESVASPKNTEVITGPNTALGDPTLHGLHEHFRNPR